MDIPNPMPSRRAFLGAAGTLAAAAGLAGCDSNARPATSAAPGSPSISPTPPARVPPTGDHQAGVITPNPAQPHLLAVIHDISDHTKAADLLAMLGHTVLSLTSGNDPRLLGLTENDLTVTIGLGPRLIARIDPRLPGAVDLPAFSREQINDTNRGGDLLLQLCATDPLVLPAAAAALSAAGRPHLRERWRQGASRAGDIPVTTASSAPRNLLGFVDGIVVPRSRAEFDRDVWLRRPARVTGATIAVYRRMNIDVGRFAELSLSEQESVFGHRRDTGAPLSGGTIATNPAFGAKTATGAYVIPADCHARRANPAASGVRLMLRRSYSMDNPPGLLFISFQNELAAFTKTLNRMDRSDALLPYTTTTASATFLILPGYDEQRPLGSTLYS